MTVNFQGYLFNDAGAAIANATVNLLETGTTTSEASTTTDVNGLWAFAEADQDRYDVKISYGSSVRYIRWDDQISLKEIDVRNNSAAGTPAATFTNLTNSASNQVAVFSGANTTRADGDVIYLSYKLANAAGELTEFARMIVEAEDTHNGSEDGAIRFQVMRDGTLATVWEVKSTGDGDVDAPTMSFDLNMDSLSIGNGADTDIVLTFDANTADGVITWMEDEDYFKFSDEILMNSTEKILFGDTGTFIHQSSDGVLTITSDTTVDINGAVVFDGALSGITTIASGAITSTGIVTGTGFTAGSAVLAEAELELLDGLTAGTAIASKVVTTDASIDTSGQRNLTITGELDAATLDLSSSADIAGDLVLSGGADGALQFTNAGENSIKIPDNQASALIIEEANNAYITFVTTNSSEAITVAKNTTFSGIVDITDTTDSSDATGDTGALRTEGGASIAKKLYVGTDLDVDGTAELDNITVGGAQGSDGQVLTSPGRGVAWEDAGGGAVSAVANGANNYVATFSSSDALNGEANLTFDGTTLTATALAVDDVAVNGKVITMTGDTSDTVVFTAGTHGTLSIVTTDDAAAAGNIQITADGTVDIDSAGVLTLDSGAAINIEPASGSAILLDGTISIDAGVVTGATSITSTAFVGDITGDVTGTADVATLATTVTITDNESTNETNAIIFTAGAAKTGGSLGLESDGDLTYNPSTGTIAATIGSFGDLQFANGWYFTELEKLDMGTGMALCRPDGEIAHVFR